MADPVVMAMQPLPLWIVAALSVLLLVVCIIALRRSGSFGSLAMLFGLPALLVVAWSAWNVADQGERQQRQAERQALDARLAQLNAAAVAPGSPLACLDGSGGERVEVACEASLFGKPESVAAAAGYVEARLRLLADGLDYSRRNAGNYDATLAALRLGLETDRYGIVAHVLAARDGCTAEACERFALFRDASVVKANITAQTFAHTVARYAANWSGASAPPMAEIPSADSTSVAAAPPPVPNFRPIDFPSAASIPPVSIMTEPPPAAGAAPPERRPPPPPAAARPR